MFHRGQRVGESKPISTFRKFARFRRKLAAISALTAFSENGRFARFAQNYAVQVSEFVRKRFSRVRRDGNWVGAARKSNNGVTFPINSIFSRAATFESQWVLIVTNP